MAVKLDDLKFSIDIVGYDTRFWYKDLLYYIGAQGNKWLIYANKTSTDSEPVFIHDDVSDPWMFDFGGGKTLYDICQDIEPYDIITRS